jgi:hypothetical protein
VNADTPPTARPEEAWRWWLAPALLLAVAATQPFLVHRAHLVPWKGGGFGMFAATDGASTRRVRLVVEREGRFEDVETSSSVAALELRARLFPSGHRLRALATAVAAREQRRGSPVTTVRVEVWRTSFAVGSLQPAETLVRELVHRVG